MTTCAACGKTVADVGQLCHLCTGRLRRDLLDVPALLAELETTALRQGKTGDGGGDGTAAPWDERARRAQHLIRNAVHTWCRIVLDDAGTVELHGPAALWLADQTGWIRLQPWAADCRNGIRGVTAAGWRAIDRPEKRWYAGPCTVQDEDGTECGATLWARMDQGEVTCRGCGWIWPVVARREWLMRAAEDIAEPASVVASAMTLMTRTRLSAATIRTWAARGQLQPIGWRGTSRLYRVGDVLKLVQQRDERITHQASEQAGDLTTV